MNEDGSKSATVDGGQAAMFAVAAAKIIAEK
jgi:hypothetical protein